MSRRTATDATVLLAFLAFDAGLVAAAWRDDAVGLGGTLGVTLLGVLLGAIVGLALVVVVRERR